jgi:hypothetical protein
MLALLATKLAVLQHKKISEYYWAHQATFDTCKNDPKSSDIWRWFSGLKWELFWEGFFDGWALKATVAYLFFFAKVS